MTRAVNRLPPQLTLEDRVRLSAERHGRLLVGPGDVQFESWGLGEAVSVMDGRVEVAATLEPMMLARAGHTGGAEGVVAVMRRFPAREDVQVRTIQRGKAGGEGAQTVVRPGLCFEFTIHGFKAVQKNTQLLRRLFS